MKGCTHLNKHVIGQVASGTCIADSDNTICYTYCRYIPAEYDVAVSTASGQFDNLVVENTKGAEQCIKYLRDKHLGRATCIILEKMRCVCDASVCCCLPTCALEFVVPWFNLLQSRLNIHTYVYIHTYIHTHIHIPEYIHTCIHTYKRLPHANINCVSITYLHTGTWSRTCTRNPPRQRTCLVCLT
jgi:hypothetical protein